MRKATYVYSDLTEREVPMRLMSSGLRWLWLAVIVIVLDRISKDWVMMHLAFFEPREILPVLNLTLAYNTGAAFSFLHSASGWQQWALGGLAVLVTCVVVVWLSRVPKNAWWLNIALCLIIAGAIGNACDRVMYGYVVDFIDFHVNDWHFAIFNIADSAICVGVAMLMLDWLRTSRR